VAHATRPSPDRMGSSKSRSPSATLARSNATGGTGAMGSQGGIDEALVDGAGAAPSASGRGAAQLAATRESAASSRAAARKGHPTQPMLTRVRSSVRGWPLVNCSSTIDRNAPSDLPAGRAQRSASSSRSSPKDSPAVLKASTAPSV